MWSQPSGERRGGLLRPAVVADHRRRRAHQDLTLARVGDRAVVALDRDVGDRGGRPAEPAWLTRLLGRSTVAIVGNSDIP